MEKITIRMSESAPVSIDPEQWPVIAEARDHDGQQYECQANTLRTIRVRRKSAAEYLVYGYAKAGAGGQFAGTRNPYAGYRVADLDAGVGAIRRVAGVLGDDHLGSECIADLPAMEI